MSNISASPVNTQITIQPVATAPTGHDAASATQGKLASLANGSLIAGFVINRDAQNNPILRTPLGDLVVQSDVFIKTGSEVVFRVDNTQTTSARIVSIDNLAPEEYAAQTPQALAQDTISASQLKAQTLAASEPLADGQPALPLPVLQGVVLQVSSTLAQETLLPLAAQQSGTVQTPSQMPLAPGTTLNLTVLDVELPPLPVSIANLPQSPDLTGLLPPAAEQPPTASAAILPQASSVQLATTPPNPQAETLPSNLSPFLAAQEVGAPPLGTANPTTTPNPYTANAASNFVTTAPTTPALLLSQAAAETPTQQATVIGHGADGANILNTALGTVKLYTAQPLPSGTILTVKVEAAPSQEPLPLNLADLPISHTDQNDFNYLGQALNQLQTTDNAALRDLLQQLPVLGPKFTSGLLFFMTAVKTGDIRSALTVRTLNRLDVLSPELMTRLSKDVSQLNQNFTNSPLDNWKGINLPLIFGNEVNLAHFYVRKEGEDGKGEAEKTGGGQRFVLDITLSELGPMQLDGFVRGGERATALELFLRSAAPLEPSITGAIHEVFSNALNTTGLAGRLVFQSGTEHFLKPQLTTPAPHLDSAAHTILA